MPNGPLDQLIDDHFSAKESAFGETQRAVEAARSATHMPELDSLLDDDDQSKQQQGRGHIFRPDKEQSFVAEEVPDYQQQMALPSEQRRPDLRSPFEHAKSKPRGVPLNRYLQDQGIPIPEGGAMPTRSEALKYDRTLDRALLKQKSGFALPNDTDIAPADVSSIPQAHRWYAQWLWKQKVIQDIPIQQKYLLQGEESKIAEHLIRSGATLGEATGRMKDAFHDFGVYFLGMGDPSILDEDREFARSLDDIRSSTDPSGIRPRSQQVEGKSIIELIQEGRGWDVGERGWYGAAGMVPDVAATVATSGAGALAARTAKMGQWAGRFSRYGATAYWYARSAPDLRRELMEMGFEDDLASSLAAISAVPYAAIEQLQIAQATAPLKQLARETVKATARQMIARQSAEMLKLWGTEFVEEVGQSGVEVFNVAVAKALSERDPSVNWYKLLTEKGRELQEAAVTIPFLIGPRQASSAVMDFVKNPSRRNYGELPEGMQKIGDASNPADDASKSTEREKEAKRLERLLQDILAGFAMSVSKDADVRARAKEMFGEDPPSVADVGTMRPEQKQQLFDTPNPTQEDIDNVWDRIRKELEEPTRQPGIEPEPGAVPVEETAPGLSPQEELRQLEEQAASEGWTYARNGEGLERIADLREQLGLPLQGQGFRDPATTEPEPIGSVAPAQEQAGLLQGEEEQIQQLENDRAELILELEDETLKKHRTEEEQEVLEEALDDVEHDLEEARKKLTEFQEAATPEPAIAEEPVPEFTEEDLNALRSMTPEEAQAIQNQTMKANLPWNLALQGILEQIIAGEETINERETLKRLAAANPEWGNMMAATLNELRAAGAKVAETTKPPPPPTQAELRQRSDDLFSEEAWESAREDTAGNSRSIIIHMSPDDFLKVAETGATEEQTSDVVEAIKAGEKLRDIPRLWFVHDGRGNAVITGHEGRNRSEAFKQLGLAEIPVVLTSGGGNVEGKWTGNAIRWNSQGEENNQDVIPGEWPRFLLKEGQQWAAKSVRTDESIPFPVPDMRTPSVAGAPDTEEPAEETPEEYEKRRALLFPDPVPKEQALGYSEDPESNYQKDRELISLYHRLEDQPLTGNEQEFARLEQLREEINQRSEKNELPPEEQEKVDKLLEWAEGRDDVVRDENGDPLIVWHGSASYKPDEHGKLTHGALVRTNIPTMDTFGVFFTTDYAEAKVWSTAANTHGKFTDLVTPALIINRKMRTFDYLEWLKFVVDSAAKYNRFGVPVEAKDAAGQLSEYSNYPFENIKGDSGRGGESAAKAAKNLAIAIREYDPSTGMMPPNVWAGIDIEAFRTGEFLNKGIATVKVVEGGKYDPGFGKIGHPGDWYLGIHEAGFKQAFEVGEEPVVDPRPQADAPQIQSAAARFMAEYESITQSTMGTDDNIWLGEEGETLATTTINKTGSDEVHLDFIGVGEKVRGEGRASRVLKQITDLADKHGVTITLRATDDTDVKPSPGYIWPLSTADLERWYARYGFVMAGGRRGAKLMRRRPSAAPAAEPAPPKKGTKDDVRVKRQAKRKKKIEDLGKEINDDLDELFGDLDGKLLDVTSSLDPELLRRVAAIGVKMVRKKIYQFSQFVDVILGKFAEKYGVEKAELLAPHLPQIWSMVANAPDLEDEHADQVEQIRRNEAKDQVESGMAAIRDDAAVEAPAEPEVVLEPKDMSLEEWVSQSDKTEEEATDEWRDGIETAKENGETITEEAERDYTHLEPSQVPIGDMSLLELETQLKSVVNELDDLKAVHDTMEGWTTEEQTHHQQLMGRRDEILAQIRKLKALEEDHDEAVGTGPAGLGDREDLDESEPVTGEVTTEGGEAVPVAEGEAGGVRGDVRSPDAPEGVAADGGEAVGDAPHDPTAAGAAASEHPTNPGSPGTNHRIKEEDVITEGPWNDRVRFEANVDAIQTLKDIEESGNPPTPEQKKALAKYVGWGGLSKVFDTNYRLEQEWKDRQKILKELLTEDEYNAANASIMNAHYTTPQVIKHIWDAARQFGFNGGKVLEPSMGVGHFFGLMPSELAEKSELTGVELDSITGRIAKNLYENATILEMGFEKAALTPDFDLVIGNVPFGNYRQVDTSGDETLADLRLKSGAYKKSLNPLIHNFFFMKSLMKTRPGGLIMMMSSTGTLDNNTDRHIDFMKENGADLVGAIRMPSSAFKSNANTGVTTDLLVFQKRMEGAEAGGQDWGGEKVDYVTADGHGAVMASPYWEENRTGLIGNIAHAKMQFGDTDRMGLEPSAGYTMDDYRPQIDKEIRRLKDRVDKDAYDNIASNTEEMDNPETPELIEDDWQSLTNWLREGNLHVQEVDGKYTLWQKQGGVLVEVEWNPPGRDKKMLRLQKINEIRDAYRNLREAEADEEATDEAIEALRKDLNELYDAYKEKYKRALNDSSSFSLSIGENPDTARAEIEALEVVVTRGDGTKEFAKSDIFRKRITYPRRTIDSADTPEDALAASLSERGGIDWEYMSDLTGIPVPELQMSLSNVLYKNPIGGWETGSIYLSGNVRKKLAVAVRAAESDAQYDRNVEALAEIQPEDWTPGQIQVNVGESWIPTEYYDQFAQEVVDRRRNMPWGKQNPGFFYTEANGEWRMRNKRQRAKVLNTGDTKSYTTFGTQDIPFDDLILLVMNGQRINVNHPSGHPAAGRTDPEATAQAEGAAAAIENAFREWLWDDGAWEERGSRLVRIYNDLNNNFAEPTYDGSHLRLPGMSEIWKRRLNDPDRGYQKDNIWRMIVTGNTMLAHSVGAGKTVQMIAAAMEMRRLGIKKRPVFVVPNTLVAQWHQDIIDVYPNAKVLAPTSTELGHGSKGKRSLMMQRMLSGDWDIILMSPESFERVPQSPEYIESFFKDEIDDLRAALTEAQMTEGKGAQTAKALQEALKQFEAMMNQMLKKVQKKLAEGEKESGPFFNEVGIDALFVDEAHEYKNLFNKTRMSRVPGIQTKLTPRPWDMFMKTSWLNQTTNGRGVFFATATPITNTMGEMHVMMRYLAPGLLEEKGITTFDQWAKRYGLVETKLEVEVAGQGLRVNSRFRKFQNIQGLQRIWNQFVDTKLRSDLDLKLPRIKERFEWLRKFADRKGKVSTEIVGHHMLPPNEGAIQIAVPISEDQQIAVDGLIARTKKIREGGVDPEEDNMLKIATEGRKIATDMRLMDPDAEDAEDGKVNVMVDNVIQVYEKSSETEFVDPESGEAYTAGGVQVLWVDRGTPKGKKKADEDDEAEDAFNLYEDIKTKLVLAGIKADEIAFIQDHDNPKKKIELFRQLNNSEKRIIIASTQSLSVGANIQQHLTAAHHLDAPWRPADVEQRDGRIIRPGNRAQEIEIYRYVTEKTFDAFMWQTLALKWGFLQDFYKGDTGVQELEDVGEAVMTPEEMLAMATGDERIARSIKLGSEIQTMDRERGAHDRSIFAARQTRAKLKGEASTAREKAKEYEEASTYFDNEREKIKDEKFDVQYQVMSLVEDEDGNVSQQMETYTEPGKAGEALNEWLLSDFPEALASKTYEIGKIFGVTLFYSEKTASVYGRLKGAQHLKFSAKINLDTPHLTFSPIFSKIKGLKAEADAFREKSGELSRSLRDIETKLKRPQYPKLMELRRKSEELRRLQIEIMTDTQSTPPAGTAEGEEGEAKMDSLREESSALAQQQHLLQDQQDEWNRIQAGGTPGPLSPYKNQPFNNYMALFPPGTPERPRGGQLQEGADPSAPLSIPEALKVDDPEVEGRLQAKHGLPPDSMLSWISRQFRYMWSHVTRAETEIHIPTILKFSKSAREAAKARQDEIGPALEYFRLLKNVGNYAQFEAYRTLHAIVGNLDREHFWIFERYVIVRNQLRALDLEEPRRHAWKTREQIEEYLKKLEDFMDGSDVVYRSESGKIVQSQGMPHIRQAIEARNAIIKEVVGEQVRLGLLPEEALNNSEHYFHQQIVELASHARLATGSRAAKPVKRGYQRKRVGADVVGEEMPAVVNPETGELDPGFLDPNTDYLQAELTWLIEANVEAHKRHLFRLLDDEFGQKVMLKRKAKHENHVRLVGGEMQLRRVRELEAQVRRSVEGPDANESDQRAMRKVWRDELDSLDPSYQYRQKKGRMKGIVLDQNPEALAGTETDQEFFEAMYNLSIQDINVPGVKAARGFFRAITDERNMMRERLGIEFMTWEKLVKRDHPELEVYEPENSNVYKAYKVPDQVIRLFQEGVISEIVIGDIEVDLDEVMVLAGARAKHVLPRDIVAQLKKLEAVQGPTEAQKTAEKLVGYWKQWVLLNPKRALPYNLRNLTGDLDPIIAAAPGVFRFIGRAMTDLKLYDESLKGEQYQLPDEIRKSIEHGVLGSGIISTEIPSGKDTEALRKLYTDANKDGSIANPAVWIGAYWRTAKKYTEWRENLLRHASFLYYLDMLKNKKLKHFGASRKHVILGIQRAWGDDFAAARLSRELLGDYNNLTAAGDAARRKWYGYPFWAFQEINLKRYPMLMLNAYSTAKMTGEEAARGFGVASAATSLTALSLRMATLYASIQLFNWLIHGDEEEELPEFEKRNLHINMGRDANGNIRTFRNVGAVGDFMEWFGLNDVIAQIPLYKEGQVDGWDLLKDMALATPTKLIGGVGVSKLLFEVVTESTLFPDPFNPRVQSRDETLASFVNARDELRFAKGMILGEGDRARPYAYDMTITSAVNPGRAALSDIYDARQRFLKNKGLERPPARIRSSIRKLKWAAQNDDYQAFKEAKKAYLKSSPSHNYSSFSKALQYLDPISQKLRDDLEVEFATNYLSDDQRRTLRAARDYAQDTRVQMWQWWKADAAERGGRVSLDEAIDKQVAAKVRELSRSKPLKKSKRAQWSRDQYRAAQWLRERGMTKRKIMKQHTGSGESAMRVRAALRRAGIR